MDSTGFRINKVYFLVSMENDKSIADIFSDIVKVRCSQLKMECEYVAVKTATEFVNATKRIEHEVRIGVAAYPYIHIECHGSDDGIKLQSEIRLPWDGVSDLIRDINIASGNNLVVSMASCYGGNLTLENIQALSSSKDGRSIAFAIVGSEKTITDYQLESGFASYFNELLQFMNLSTAIEQLNLHSNYNGRYTFLTCVSVYKTVIINFVQNTHREHYSSESALNAKVEQLAQVYSLQYRRKLRPYEKSMLFKLVKDKNFYIEFFKELRDRYFMIDLFPENAKRFPRVFDIEGFDENIRELGL